MSTTPRGNDAEGIWIPAGAKIKRDAPAPPPEPAPEPAVEAAPEPPAEPEVDYQDKYLRALAEVENVRRRATEQQRLAVQRANEGFVADLLPVLDGVERGLAAASGGTSLESLQQGLDLVGRQLQSFLESHGVELIACAVGEPFDPEVHEAMMRMPAPDVAEGHIAAVLERGFKLHGRVLRAARVAVAAEPLDAEA